MHEPAFDQFLRAIISTLEELGHPYMIGGSVASSLYGEPRSTQDVDIAVVIPLDEVGPFVQAFEALDYYVSLEAAIDALIHRLPFNIIDPESGYKADIFIIETAKAEPLEQSALARRQRLTISEAQGASASFYSPEDVILYKLKYFVQGRSDKHLRDILAMLVVQGASLDVNYVSRWAVTIGADEVWRRLWSEYQRRINP